MWTTLKNSFAGTSQFGEDCLPLNQLLKVTGKCPGHILKGYETIKYYNESLL